jgi:hypothetical protein
VLCSALGSGDGALELDRSRDQELLPARLSFSSRAGELAEHFTVMLGLVTGEVEKKIAWMQFAIDEARDALARELVSLS